MVGPVAAAVLDEGARRIVGLAGEGELLTTCSKLIFFSVHSCCLVFTVIVTTFVLASAASVAVMVLLLISGVPG